MFLEMFILAVLREEADDRPSEGGFLRGSGEGRGCGTTDLGATMSFVD